MLHGKLTLAGHYPSVRAEPAVTNLSTPKTEQRRTVERKPTRAPSILPPMHSPLHVEPALAQIFYPS